MRKLTFQDLILTLQNFWAAKGCVILQPYDKEMGAGTFHPATTLAGAGPAALECRLCAAVAAALGRPLWREPQPAAALLSVPGDPEAGAGKRAGALSGQPATPSASIPALHDIRFVEDDWESPTLGAWGLGWEVWCDGMEITQFTYFQQVGGIECDPVAAEITYGLERLAMYIQSVENSSMTSPSTARRPLRRSLPCRTNRNIRPTISRVADTEILFRHFQDAETAVPALAGGDKAAAAGL